MDPGIKATAKFWLNLDEQLAWEKHAEQWAAAAVEKQDVPQTKEDMAKCLKWAYLTGMFMGLDEG